MNILLSLICRGVIGPLAEPDVCSDGRSALAGVQKADEHGQQRSHRLGVLQVHLCFHLVRSDRAEPTEKGVKVLILFYYAYICDFIIL